MTYAITERNRDFVNFAAAFAGHISANFRSIHFAALDQAHFQVQIVLRRESARDQALIREALEDFEAMRQPPYDEPFNVDCKVVITEAAQTPPVASTFLALFIASDE